MAWARFWTPIACPCFVNASFNYMPSISATSCMTWETKMLPLSVIMSVRRYECLFMMSLKTFAVFFCRGVGNWIGKFKSRKYINGCNDIPVTSTLQ